MTPLISKIPATEITAEPPKLSTFSPLPKTTGTFPAGVQTVSFTGVPNWLERTLNVPEILKPVNPTTPTFPDVVRA